MCTRGFSSFPPPSPSSVPRDHYKHFHVLCFQGKLPDKGKRMMKRGTLNTFFFLFFFPSLKTQWSIQHHALAANFPVGDALRFMLAATKKKIPSTSFFLFLSLKKKMMICVRARASSSLPASIMGLIKPQVLRMPSRFL